MAPFASVIMNRCSRGVGLVAYDFLFEVECGLCGLWALLQPFVCHMEESIEWWGATLAGVHWYTGSPMPDHRV